MDCGICTDTFTKNRVAVCPGCQYVSCAGCLRQYFTELSDPACPNCSLVWTREFISLNFDGFYQDYKKMRERVLFEREKILMPETQADAEREVKAREIEEDVKRMTLAHDLLFSKMTMIKNQIKKRKDDISKLRRGENLAGEAAEPTQKIVCNCPLGTCRGFVIAPEHKCGLCNTVICKKCQMIIYDKEHTCKKEDIETVAMKKRETKQCPKCHIDIYKIDGCDQMWCTQCKTAFSWKTGEEIHTRIHNPHYYEWQRQMNGGVAPRVPGDNQPNCDQIMDWWSFKRYLPDYEKLYTRNENASCRYIASLHMFVGHIEDYFDRPTPTDNKKMRIQYMLGEITEEYFARRIQQIDKKKEKDIEMRQICQVMSSGTNDIFRKIVEDARGRFVSFQRLDEAVRDANQLVDFVNSQFKIVAEKYKVQVKKIVIRDGHQFHIE